MNCGRQQRRRHVCCPGYTPLQRSKVFLWTPFSELRAHRMLETAAAVTVMTQLPAQAHMPAIHRRPRMEEPQAKTPLLHLMLRYCMLRCPRRMGLLIMKRQRRLG